MEFSNLLRSAAIRYPQEKTERVNKDTEIYELFIKKIPKKLNALIDLSDYKIAASVGKGNSSEIPWISIVDPEITKTPTEGFYVVFLFSADGSRIYLTLNQGITYFKKHNIENYTAKIISNEICKKIFKATSKKTPVLLNSNGSLGRGYEATTIFAYEYAIDKIPTDDVIKDNLLTLLDEYKKLKNLYIETGSNIDKFYDDIIKENVSKYFEFQSLLKEFVDQVNLNVSNKDKSRRKTTIGSEKFNNFKHENNEDLVDLSGTRFHVHLFKNGHYGPETGRGTPQIPYLNYELTDGTSVNIRLAFENYRVTSVYVTTWPQQGSTDKNDQWSIDELNLHDKKNLTEGLITLYDKFLGLKEKVNNKMVDKNIQKMTKILDHSKNVILRGAPGTGKTFLAKSIAADIVSEGTTTDITNLSKEQQSQIGFVQFHPSYDYTDFVEGLRPLTRTDGSMGFELKDGTFTCFVKQARQNFELSRKSLQEQNIENDAWNVVDAYLDNVELLEDKLKIQSGNEFYFEVIDEENIQLAVPKNEISSKVVLKRQTLKDMVASEMEFTRSKDISNFFSNRKRRRQEDSYYFAVYNDIKEKQKNFKHETNELKVVEKPFVFIIDEINRGEISKIFGELFYSIDPGYRGMVGSVSTQYANLHDDPSEKFFVPENVYIIGTMNDIDRSVDSFDFAMRRRFRFVEVKASNQLKMLDELDDDTKEQAIQKLTNLNNAISATDELNDNYQIGPSYFLKLRQIGFDDLWDDYLQPLLKEYIRGMYNENDIMDRFQQAYNQVSDQDDDDTNSR